MQNQSKNVLLVSAIVLIAAATRLIPHPMNFAPLGAMALFGAAYFGKRGLGLLLTMGAWFLSDLFLNNVVYSMGSEFTLFTPGSFFIYGSIVLIFLLGSSFLKQITLPRILGGSLMASAIFFTFSNLGVWIQGTMYPMTGGGLVACYAAAIPFLKFTILGDLCYSGVLFVAYERIFKEQLKGEEVRK